VGWRSISNRPPTVGRRSRSGAPRFDSLRARAFILLIAAVSVASSGCKSDVATRSEPHPAPKRIVSLTPSITETLFALGLGPRVVGVGEYTYWPSEAMRKPRIGGLFNPNVERIAALRPDLAVLMPSERDLALKLAPLGVESLIVPIESLADVERSFLTIAERCGVPEAGRELRREWRAGLEHPAESGTPLRVVLSVGRDAGRLGDVTVAARGTFLDELLSRSGAVNAFADAPSRYPQVGLEEIVARSPDLIVEIRSEPMTPEASRALVGEWDQLPGLVAERRRRIVVIAADYALIPGPRLPLLARDLRAALAQARKESP